jgi:hypothetical protein
MVAGRTAHDIANTHQRYRVRHDGQHRGSPYFDCGHPSSSFSISPSPSFSSVVSVSHGVTCDLPTEFWLPAWTSPPLTADSARPLSLPCEATARNRRQIVGGGRGQFDSRVIYGGWETRGNKREHRGWPEEKHPGRPIESTTAARQLAGQRTHAHAGTARLPSSYSIFVPESAT